VSFGVCSVPSEHSTATEAGHESAVPDSVPAAASQHIESTGLRSVVSIDEAGHESAAPDSVVDVNGLAQTPSSVIEAISPLPKSIAVRTRKRKVQAAEVITSSPYKQRLLDRLETSKQKDKKNEKSKPKTMTKGKQKKVAKKKKRTCREDKPRGRKPKAKAEDAAMEAKKQKHTLAVRKQKKIKAHIKDGDVACIMCGEDFKHSASGESWIQCKICQGWCHYDCSAGESSRGFVCDFCERD